MNRNLDTSEYSHVGLLIVRLWLRRSARGVGLGVGWRVEALIKVSSGFENAGAISPSLHAKVTMSVFSARDLLRACNDHTNVEGGQIRIYGWTNSNHYTQAHVIFSCVNKTQFDLHTRGLYNGISVGLLKGQHLGF